MIGRVRPNISTDRGFCFVGVTIAQQTTDYFAHRSELRDVTIAELQPGDVVSFTPVRGERGWRATEIRRAAPDAEDGPEMDDTMRILPASVGRMTSSKSNLR